jgi:hypothetical protein
LWEEFGEEVEFIVVYIREAHALEETMAAGNVGLPAVEAPTNDIERMGVAQQCHSQFDLGEMTLLVDGIDDAVEDAYYAHPDRLYLVGKDGSIAYHGLQGPNGMRPDELLEAIEDELELMD